MIASFLNAIVSLYDCFYFIFHVMEYVFFWQVCAGQSVLRSEYAIPARSFAKGAGGPPQSLKGDGEF